MDRGGGDTVTTQLAPWHWRDKFDARNPEEANRQQLLKIEKQISFAKWLKAKRKEERKRDAVVAAVAATKREDELKEREAKEKERKDNKRRQREDAKQRRDELKARELADAQQKRAANEKAKRVRAKNDKVKNAYNSIMRGASKPQPERPSFKEWMARKKREDLDKLKAVTRLSKSQAQPLSKIADSDKVGGLFGHEMVQTRRNFHGILVTWLQLMRAQHAYAEWVERKQLEGRMKQKLSKEDQHQKALEEKLLHAQTWQKKAIVCAYSQNRSEKPEQWRATTASLLS